MKFKCYPFFKPGIHLIYSSSRAFKSIFFSELTLQISSKNSLVYRFSKLPIGDTLAYLNTNTVEVPIVKKDFIGIVKSGKIILFELNDVQYPKFVWRKLNSKWIKELFIGHQLIAEYSIKELDSKKLLILKALKLHKSNLEKSRPLVHGDLTHFNILINDDLNISFIDSKNHENSPLFDFFYFSAYLKNSISRDSVLTSKVKLKLEQIINEIIYKVCAYRNKKELDEDLSSLYIPDGYTSFSVSLPKRLKEFKNLLQSQFILIIILLILI